MSDALPGDAGYVFAAYIVLFILLLIYLGILGAKFQRVNREITELTEEIESGRKSETAVSTGTGAKEPTGV